MQITQGRVADVELFNVKPAGTTLRFVERGKHVVDLESPPSCRMRAVDGVVLLDELLGTRTLFRRESQILAP